MIFGSVRIRLLRSVSTIAEPWGEGDGFEYKAKVDVARVAEPGFFRCHHQRHAACVAIKPGGPPLTGDGSETVICPVDDVH